MKFKIAISAIMALQTQNTVVKGFFRGDYFDKTAHHSEKEHANEQPNGEEVFTSKLK